MFLNLMSSGIKQKENGYWDNKKMSPCKMVPVVRTLEKKCFIYRYFFIYLNFKIWGLGTNMNKITFSTDQNEDYCL